MMDIARATTRWTIEYLIVALIVVFAMSGGTAIYYAWDYHQDRTMEEIINEELVIVGEPVGGEVTLAISGEKVRGLPLIEFEERTCRPSGFVDVGAQQRPCEPGQTVEVRISPTAYGIMSQKGGARRVINMIPVPRNTAQTYPAGKFDAGWWVVDVSPRFEGDPGIVGIEIAVTHEGRYGPRTETFDTAWLYDRGPR